MNSFPGLAEDGGRTCDGATMEHLIAIGPGVGSLARLTKAPGMLIRIMGSRTALALAWEVAESSSRDGQVLSTENLRTRAG